MDKKQLFVKVDEYKDITEILTLAHQRLEQAKTTLARIADLKQQEDSEFESWSNELAEIERRVEAVDRTLSGSKEE